MLHCAGADRDAVPHWTDGKGVSAVSSGSLRGGQAAAGLRGRINGRERPKRAVFQRPHARYPLKRAELTFSSSHLPEHDVCSLRAGSRCRDACSKCAAPVPPHPHRISHLAPLVMGEFCGGPRHTAWHPLGYATAKCDKKRVLSRPYIPFGLSTLHPVN